MTIVALGMAGACTEDDLEERDVDELGVDAGAADAGPALPETWIDAAPPPLTTEQVSVLAFSSDAPLARFVCRIDDGAPAQCASPWTIELPPGSHRVTVAALDLAGNRDASPAVHRWLIVSTRPDPPAPLPDPPAR